MSDSVSLIELDAIDIRLLGQLQTDASLSYEALAQLARVSPATCLRRVKRLVEAGVIAQRVAIVDASRFAPALTAVTEVTLDRQGAEHLAAFEARAVAEAAVQQCYRVSPGPDFVLVAQVAGETWASWASASYDSDASFCSCASRRMSIASRSSAREESLIQGVQMIVFAISSVG